MMSLFCLVLLVIVNADRSLYSYLRTNGSLVIGRQTDVLYDPNAISIRLSTVTERDSSGNVVQMYNTTAARTTEVGQMVTTGKYTYDGIPTTRQDHYLCLSGSAFPCNGTLIQTTALNFEQHGYVVMGLPSTTVHFDCSLPDPRSMEFILFGCDGSFKNTTTVVCPLKDVNLTDGVYMNGGQISYSSDVPEHLEGKSLEYDKIDALAKEQRVGYLISPASGDVVEISTYIKFVSKLPTPTSAFGFASSDSPLDHDSRFMSTITEPDEWYFIQSRFRAVSDKPISVYFDVTGFTEETTIRLYNLSINIYTQAAAIEEGTIKFSVAVNNWKWVNNSTNNLLDLMWSTRNLDYGSKSGGPSKNKNSTTYNFNDDTVFHGPYTIWFPSYYNRDGGPNLRMANGFPSISIEKTSNSTSSSGKGSSKRPARFFISVRMQNDNNTQLVYDPFVNFNRDYVSTPADQPAPKQGKPTKGTTFPVLGVVSIVLLTAVVGTVIYKVWQRQKAETQESSWMRGETYSSLALEEESINAFGDDIYLGSIGGQPHPPPKQLVIN